MNNLSGPELDRAACCDTEKCQCSDCKRERKRRYNRNYYQANRERLVQYRRDYVAANRDEVNAANRARVTGSPEIKARRRRQYRKRKDAINAQRRIRRAENAEHARAVDRAWRKANSESLKAYNRKRWAQQKRRKGFQLKRAARDAVAKAIARGDLCRPGSCEECGTSGCDIQGHHDDYSQPLVVRWLCRPCHADLHLRERGLR